jgi:hypothetical protein
MGSHKIPSIGLDGWWDGWMDRKIFMTMTSFTICNRHIPYKPLQDCDYKPKKIKKKTTFLC